MKKTLLALALAAASCATPQFTNQTALSSAYMLRGQDLSGGKPVVQDTLVATSGPVSVIAFGNYNTQSRRTDEADLTLNYDVTVGDRLRLSPNLAYLTFPNTPLHHRTELAVKATLDETYSLNIVQDLDNKEGFRRGTYVEAGAKKQFDFLGLHPVADIAAGWENHFLSNQTGFRHLDGGIGVPFSLLERKVGDKMESIITLTPGIRRTFSLNDKAANDQLYGGLTLEIKF
ncbi:MAG: hypothetical protein Q7S65_02915 [Nanoarchaeota archaeon]|nr:hypothetical protein [Nanoarchaeota archaeon]